MGNVQVVLPSSAVIVVEPWTLIVCTFVPAVRTTVFAGRQTELSGKHSQHREGEVRTRTQNASEGGSKDDADAIALHSGIARARRRGKQRYEAAQNQ